MNQRVLQYLKKRLPLMSDSDIEDTFKQADHVYSKEDGALGVTEIDRGFFRIVFFAADSKETRNKLLEEAWKAHPDVQVIVYERLKHKNKPFFHTRPYFERFLAT
jgi:hypothetical protein